MKFKRLFLQLLPTGLLWNKEEGSNLDKLADGSSREFARIDRRSSQLLEELNPLKTSELLPEWEKLVGLPDPAFGSPQSAQERRNLVVLKYSSRGGQSRKFYIDLIKKFGFKISIKEHRAFRAGKSRAGDRVYTGLGWKFTWTVQMREVVRFNFRAGKSRAGDKLRYYRNDVVQGIIKKLKPAHTNVLFQFFEE